MENCNGQMNKGYLLVFFCLVIAFGFLKDSRLHYHERPSLVFNKNLFQDGDLIFRKGTGLFSNLFSSVGKEKTPYSHVGLVRLNRDKVFVIHAEANEFTGIGFVKMEPIETFLDDTNSHYGSLYRIIKFPKIYRKEAARIAESFARLRIPFDKTFDLSTEDSLYCTEMVWLAYKKAGMNIVINPEILETPTFKKEIISLSAVLNSGSFIKKLKEGV